MGVPCTAGGRRRHDGCTLLTAHAPLVYLAPELTCEAQREAVAIADLLRASLDSVSRAMAGVLAAQQRGRASATLGEIRNRADLVIFWGVDPGPGIPAFGSATRRTRLDATCRKDGDRARSLLWTSASSVVFAMPTCAWRSHPSRRPACWCACLHARRQRRRLSVVQASPPPAGAPSARGTGRHIRRARYVAIVADADAPRTLAREGDQPRGVARPLARLERPDAWRPDLLRAAAATAPAPTRWLTWQTGFPAANRLRARVSSLCALHAARRCPHFQRGNRCGAHRGEHRGTRPAAGLDRTDHLCVIGPHARRAISRRAPQSWIPASRGSTGGTVLRMDDVPLPVESDLRGPPDTE